MQELGSCPGPQNANYAAEVLMPLVRTALAAVLREHPKDPVEKLQRYLRDHNPARPFLERTVDAKPYGKLVFHSRVTPIDKESGMPIHFKKAGEYPVWGLELPRSSMLPSIINQVAADNVEQLHWIVCGLGSIIGYMDNAPCQCVPPTSTWKAAEGAKRRTSGPQNETSNENVKEQRRVDFRRVESTLLQAAGALPAARVLEAACSKVKQLKEVTVQRLQHPSDVPVSFTAIDDLTSFLDKIPSNTNTAIVIVSCDQWEFVQHIQTFATLYFRIQREAHYIRRILRILDSQSGEPEPNIDIEQYSKDVERRRKQRDATRTTLQRVRLEMLVSSDMEEPVETMLKRDQSAAERAQRRERTDRRRQEILAEQGAGAAVRMQSFIRGALIRRRNPRLRRIRRSEDEVEMLLLSGRYPLVDLTLGSLIDSFGCDMFTTEIPKRGNSKPEIKWDINITRIPPIDEIDVSSEDEEWTARATERVAPDFSANFNPQFDVERVLKAVGKIDLAHMFDVARHYSGLSALQRKGFAFLERYTTYILYAAFMSIHHKKKMADDGTFIAASQAVAQILRIPGRLENCGSFSDFMSIHSPPQEWLNYPQWTCGFYAFSPVPLLSIRIVIGADTSTGAYLGETLLNQPVQHFCPPAPIFVAPECLTIDQWAEAALSVARKQSTNGHKIRRVLWVSLRPEFTAFVSGVPFFAVSRSHNHTHGPDLPPVMTVRNAKISITNGQIPSPRELAGDALVSNLSMSIFTPSDYKCNCTSPLLTIPGDNMSFSMDDSQTLRKSSMEGLGDRRESFKEVVQSMKRRPTLRGDLAKDVKAFASSECATTWYGVPWIEIEKQLAKELETNIDQHPDGRLAFHSLKNPAESLISALRTNTFQDLQLCSQPMAPDTLKKNLVRVTNRRQARPELDPGAGSTLPSARTGGRQSTSHFAAGRRVNRVGRQATMVRIHEASQNNSSESLLAQAGGASQLFTPNRRQTRVPGAPRIRADRNLSKSSGGSEAQPRVSIASGASGGEGNDNPAVKPVGGVRGELSRRVSRMSLESLGEGAVFEDDLEGYPEKAGDVIRTPFQAAEDIRSRLTSNADRSDNVNLVFRRVPLLPVSGNEFWGMLDMLIAIVRDYLGDPRCVLVLGASSSDSLFCTVLVLMVWAVEFDKEGVLLWKAPEAPAGRAAYLDRESCSLCSEPRSPLVDSVNPLAASLRSGGSSAQEASRSIALLMQKPLTPFPSLQRIVTQNPRLEIDIAIRNVDLILEQTGTTEILFGSIEKHMQQAGTTGDKNEIILAVCAFERYVELVLLYAFLKDTQRHREMMSMMALDTFSFELFLKCNPQLIEFLHYLDPWEGRDDIPCPIGRFSELHTLPHRWRRATWMPDIA